MEQKEKMEGLKFIAQIHRSQFDERRKYEWKIIFTLLSFYVLSVTAVYRGNVLLPDYSKVIISISFPLLALLTAIFLGFLHKANSINKGIAQKAEDSICDLVASEKPEDVKVKNPRDPIDKSWYNWAWQFQILILIAFSIVSAWVLTLR